MKSKVELKLEGQYIQPYIDGEPLPFCHSAIPQDESLLPLRFKMMEKVFEGNVEVDLAEYTKIAMIILRNELLKHGDLYNGFLASINSAIKEKADSAELWHSDIFIDTEDWAESALSRIIGEE